ncbi:hypothetical protein GOP47_0022523 [Adiantum capillus-veneris]|uniref:Cysteine proteinase n=1 Tax=Adiantum capillus-veneris TaxID=13818 RepID=A0A9D4U5I1_ADICA|nr:hypothetical protein GOP47_0022523 [Adiantum capillus-veneris]
MRGLTCATSALLALLLCICATTSHAASPRHVAYDPSVLSSEARILQLFNHWRRLHHKNYTFPDGTSEKYTRFKIFRNNLFYIHGHDSNPLRTYTLGLNRFADLTLAEFKAKHLGLSPSSPRIRMLSGEQLQPCSTRDLPNSVDWRLQGAVTPVKDQGQCGSCWAFSSTGAIEGAYAINTGKLVSLSEQELVSCAHSNNGCNGGLMDPAFEWVMRNGGINTEENYPYVSTRGRTKLCNWLLRREKAVTINGYEDVRPNDEDALLCAVAKQPVSVAINAGTQDFQLYVDGIFSGSCSDDPDDLDHAVLVVGYGSEHGKDYWIVKNSWSEAWGKGGYVHIERSSGHVHGVCGIHSIPSYPIIKQNSPPSSSDI